MQVGRSWGNYLLTLLWFVWLSHLVACTVSDDAAATPQPSPGPIPTTLADVLKAISAANGVANPDTPVTGETPFKVRPGFSPVEVRMGPGRLFALVTYLDEGSTCQVIATNGLPDAWYLIVLENGRTGWVSATALEPVGLLETAFIPTAATLPPVPFPTLTPSPRQQTPLPLNTLEALSPIATPTRPAVDLPAPTSTENPYP